MYNSCHRILSKSIFYLISSKAFASSSIKIGATCCFQNSAQKAYCTSSLGIDQDNGDTFGSLAKSHGVSVFHDYPFADEEDDKKVFVPFYERKDAAAFHYECKKLAYQDKLDQCVETLEITMLKEHKVKPLENNFSIVIGALGRKGDLKRTLSLFKKMKSYLIKPSAVTYTGVFNAFANCSQSRLDELSKIYSAIKDQNVLNRQSYNALLKAYAVHDSLSSCMSILRESILAGFEPDVISFTYMLLCCEKDKISGSRYAIQMWKQMINLGIKPDGQFFMHFLKVLLHCDVGDIALMSEELQKPQSENLKYFLKKHVRNFRWLKGQESHPNPVNTLISEGDFQETVPLLEAAESNAALNSKTSCSIVKSNNSPADLSLVNVLDPPKHLAENIILQDCSKPSNRFQLIGGVKNIFELLRKYQVKPTVQLLSVISVLLENDSDAEDDFMLLSEKLKVKLDIDFYNGIMHKRAKRCHFNDAEAVWERINKLQIAPNFRSWCIRAICCQHYEKGRNLLDEMSQANVTPNSVLFTTLIVSTLRNPRNRLVKGYTDVKYPNYRYLSYILHEMTGKAVAPNKKLIIALENAVSWPAGYNRWKLVDSFMELERNKFKKSYRKWLETTNFN